MPSSGMGSRVLTSARTPVQVPAGTQPSGTEATLADGDVTCGPGSQAGTPSPRSAIGANDPKPSWCSSSVTAIPYDRSVTYTGARSPGGALLPVTNAITMSGGSTVIP